MSWSALDYRADPQLVTGIRTTMGEAVRTATPEEAALSWHVALQLDIERDTGNRSQDRGSGVERMRNVPGLCRPIPMNTPDLYASAIAIDAGGTGDIVLGTEVTGATGKSLYVIGDVSAGSGTSLPLITGARAS